MVLLKPLFGSLGLLCLLSSCWSPVFDENLSLAALTRGKLTLDAQFQGNFGYGSDTTAFAAYPTRVRPPTKVNVLALGAASGGLSTFVKVADQWMTGGGSIGQSFPAPLDDPEQVYGEAGFNAMAIFLPSETLVGYTDSPGQSYSEITTGLASYPGVGSAEAFYLIAGNQTPPSYELKSDSIALSSAHADFSRGSVTFRSNLASPFTNETGWLAVDPRGVPVVYFTGHSRNAAGEYTTKVFDDTSILTTWTRRDRVVAFLTTGELLTREGAFYDVCDRQGKIQYSFPAGSLKFAGEFWDTTTNAFRCWFTEVVPQDGSQPETLRVSVYSLPTSDLNSLK